MHNECPHYLQQSLVLAEATYKEKLYARRVNYNVDFEKNVSCKTKLLLANRSFVCLKQKYH
jgi:hypothetical protein